MFEGEFVLELNVFKNMLRNKVMARVDKKRKKWLE
jgi:hypothetical protein